MEEAGFGAHQQVAGRAEPVAGVMSQKIQVVLAARDLYAQSLPGDEPEPLRVDRVDLGELSALVEHQAKMAGVLKPKLLRIAL